MEAELTARNLRERSHKAPAKSVQPNSSTDQPHGSQAPQHQEQASQQAEESSRHHNGVAHIHWQSAVMMQPDGSNSRKASSKTERDWDKPQGYVASRFCGVTGTQHLLGCRTRWRAATWDPVIKKTIYIGSYEEEKAAAAAVDAWHASHGRPPVNFKSCFSNPDAEADEYSAADAVGPSSLPVRQRSSGYGSDVSEEAEAKRMERYANFVRGMRSPQGRHSVHGSQGYRPR